MGNTFLTCPTDCGTLNFPAIDVDQDCTAFEITESEVCGVLIVQDGNYPTDWTSVAAWELVINNPGTTAADGKYLVGRGGVPVADKTTVELPKNIDRTITRKYALNLNILNMSDQNYEFLRAAQCGDTSIRVWFETVGGFLYGGPTGISPSIVDADLPLNEGRDSYEQGTLLVGWEADGDTARSGSTIWTGVTQTDVGGSTLATVFGFASTAFGTGTTALGPVPLP